MFLNTIIAKTTLVIFILFFLLSLFFWLKNWFEINKFQKLQKIKNDLLLLKSPFYLNKMTEVRKLTLQNKSYLPIFNWFFQNYQELFVQELDELLTDFVNILSKENEIKYFLLERENLIIFFQNYKKLQTKIEKFSNNLRIFSTWENFCLGKSNEFNLLLEKVFEEIERMKIAFSFDFTQFDKKFNYLQQEISIFEKSIYQKQYSKTFLIFCDLETQISSFLKQVYVWIKIVNVFLVFLPKKQEKLTRLLADANLKTQNNFINNFINYYQKETIKIENYLLEWEIFKAQDSLLLLLQSVDDNIYQLENQRTLFSVFNHSFQTATNYFDKIKKNILDLLHFSNNLDKKNFFQRFQEAGFGNFNFLIQENQKIIDNLYVKSYKTDKLVFFKPLIIEVEKILKSLLNLFNIYNQMDHFFTRESEQIEKIILTLMNLNTIFNKKENFFLKMIYEQEFVKCVDYFINFEEKKYNSSHSNFNYTVLLSRLQNQVFNLKLNVQNTILLKNISEFLFVKANKKRFQTEENWNKIINCEVLFLKQQYKNVIDILLDVVNVKYDF